MRILLFDWYSGGHHALYLAEFTRALAPLHTVIAAAPASEAAAAAAHGAEPLITEESFPTVDMSRRLSRDRRRALHGEVELLREAVRESGADHALHLFADSLLPVLLSRRPVGAPLSVLLFRPRAHVPSPHVGRPPTRELVRSRVYEAVVGAWRLRPDANAVLTLDPLAAARWSGRRGAPVLAVPEPPVPASPMRRSSDRRGAALVGALSARKGIQHVVAALEHDRRPPSLVLAGILYPDYARVLEGLVQRLRSAGVEVDLLAGYQDVASYLGVVGTARAVLLPYVGHVGMSRVLLEAAAMGTPVVAHEEGLVGHLVRTRRLGLTVDCRNPRAFASAIHELVDDPEAVARYSPWLEEFAGEHTSERFVAVVRTPFQPPLTKRPSNWRRRPVAGS